MVLIIWRQTQKIKPDKWDELEELEKRFLKEEKRLGFPTDTKKRYRAVMGSSGVNTLIIEFQWESMAKMEKIITKSLLDPEYQKLTEEGNKIIDESRWDIFVPWPIFPE
ncbi:MAG: hypothetical protein BAJALOKI2v1_1090004 [Promethearchaeota archaeon]|nr:MAG: hypothetical protein BAJALOKI2v1_1090004 [Candidatus Lokiarchaeota archaeon]